MSKTTCFTALGFAVLALTSLVRAEDRFERPGITADRATRTVRVEALATGLEKGTQAEFILIGPKSGHAYESVAVAIAAPGDVRAAIEFIGLQRGKPMDPAGLRFWPRGPRIEAMIEWTAAEGGESVVRRIRAEETILDRRTGKTLPPDGFVFAGSFFYRNEEGTDVYAPDAQEPMSIIAAFNHRMTVLDIPRQGSQDDLYDHQFVNAEFGWKEKQPLTFVLRPARPDGPPFESDLRLAFRPGPDNAPVFEFALNGGAQETAADVPALARRLRELAGADRHVFATATFDERLPLRALRTAAGWVQRLADEHGVRLEPPAEGDLYYRAFLPNEAFRDRTRRPAQPWELKLWVTGGSGRIMGTLLRVTPRPDSEPPTFDETRYEVETPAALRAALDEHGPGLAVILVYAPAGLPYKELRDFVLPVLATHPIVYFFEE